MSLLGTTIGRIRLIDRLGKGGMGLLLQELFTGERPLPRQPMTVLLAEAAEGRSRPVVGLGRALSELIEGLKELKPSRRAQGARLLRAGCTRS